MGSDTERADENDAIPTAPPQRQVARSPLNGPLEVGMRILMVLTEAFPAELDLNQLVLIDHAVLHSGDIGGPSSLHPAVPMGAGEISVKRQTIQAGTELLVRFELAEIHIAATGVLYFAGSSAQHFVDVLGSGYSVLLRDRVKWALSRFDNLTEEVLRESTKAVFNSWSEEFHWSDIGRADPRKTT